MGRLRFTLRTKADPGQRRKAGHESKRVIMCAEFSKLRFAVPLQFFAHMLVGSAGNTAWAKDYTLVPETAPEHLLSVALADPSITFSAAVVLVTLAILLAISIFRRRMTEKRLRAESEKHISLFTNSSEGIVLVDSRGIITDANPKIQTIMGMELDQLVGVPGATLLHPDDAPLSAEAQRRLDAGMAARMQRRIRTRKGSYIPVDMSIKHITDDITQIMFRDLSELEISRRKLSDANQELAAMYEQVVAANQQMQAANRDLQSEMKARCSAEEGLRERETLLRTVLKATPVGIGMVTDRVIGWTNETLQTLLGYSAEELDGMQARELYESDAEFERVGRVKHAEVERTGYGSIETRLLPKKGEAIDVMVSSRSIINGDMSQGLVFTVQDLTELHLAQEETRELREILFRESSVVQILLDPDSGDIMEANRAASDYFKMAPGSLQMASIDTIFTGSPAKAYATLQNAAFSEEPAHFEVKRGSEHSYAEVHVSPLSMEGRTFFYAILHDVAERIQAEAALLEAKNLAESASRMKNEFLANMSHEVRTPLNGIFGMLQLLHDTGLTQEQNDFVNAAIQAGQGLQAILNDILEFSMIEAGKVPISRGSIALRRLVDNISLVFRRQCMDKNIDLTMRIADDVPEYLGGDEARLRQILFNLVGNAIKFTENGGVAIEVSRLASRDDTGIRLMFLIRDTGIGIPDDKLETIFDPFTQADGSLTRRFEGAGLGLSIVKRLCDLMGGSIAVISEIGKGTELNVVLPFQEFEEPIPILPEKMPDFDKSKAERRVLIAEDNPVNRIATRRFVEKMGFDTVCARDGSEALEALHTHAFDCILMDIQMPVMSGVEATRLIRSDTSGRFDPQIPIVALTAHAMTGDRERFLHEGMNAYLPKPVDFSELARLLSTYL